MMGILHTAFLLFLILSDLLPYVYAQEQTIVFSIDAGEGLIYLLLIIFFTVNFCTPVGRYIYTNYFEELVAKAQKHAEKVKKRLTEQMGDVSRRTMQSVRTSTTVS